MGTLEVHDGRGRVERINVRRDQPLMLGSSPKADVVMAGDGVLPFHARLRWHERKHQYRVEASPEVPYLLVNGRKLNATNLALGDEIEVGSFRVFLIHDGEPDEPEARTPADDRTVVRPPPLAASTAPAPSRKPSKTRRRAPANALADAFADLDDVLSDDDPGEAVVSAPARPAPKPGPGARLAALLRRGPVAPGEERILSSPLIVGLAASFLALTLLGVALYALIVRTAANRLYAQAVENLQDGDYRNAIRRFDEFLKANREDARAGKARVHRAMANVRQYAAGSGASWSLALEAERAMLSEVGAEVEFRDSRTELDELVLRTGEGLADRAKASGDRRVLTEAESVLALHAEVAGGSAAPLLKRSRFPEKLDAARAAVRKTEVRAAALAAMDAGLKQGSSSAVYDARDALVAAYADLAEDRALLSRMTAANDLIRKGVTTDPSQRPAETEPHPEPFGPATTFVARQDHPGAAPASGPTVFALAEGMALGIDAGNGAPLWQTPLGLAAPYPPQGVPGGTAALAFDARTDELVRLDGKTGALVWRQALGEPVTTPPLVLGNQLVQVAPSGKVIFLDLATGSVQATMNLGMPLAGSAVSDESGSALFVAAAHDCLFVLTRDPPACTSVAYLGHAPGAIACPPARLGRYLIVPENHALDASRWRVLVIAEKGAALKEVQQVPVLGWTWSTPAAPSGPLVWAAGDRGGVAVYAVGDYTQKVPFRPVARISPDATTTGPAFAFAPSGRELLVASGRSARYELDPEKGKITASWTLAEAGPAAAPPQTAGPLLVLTQQNTEGPGLALSGVEPKTGAVRWRTLLGLPWPSPPRPDADGQGLTALGLDGLPIPLSVAQVGRGGFVPGTLPSPGKFRLPAEAFARVDGAGWTAVVPALRAGALLVRAAGGAYREVSLPAPVGAAPLAFAGGLLLPGDDGRVYLIDPTTGAAKAEPFVPPFDRARPTRWRDPAPLGADAVALADAAGRVRKLVVVNDPRPRLVAAAEVTLDKDVTAGPATTEQAVVLGTADGQVRALTARDLSPAGGWALPAPLALPLASAGGRVFAADATGGLLAVGPAGQRLWQVRLGGGTLAGPPAVVGEVVWLLTRDGRLVGLDLADGKEADVVPLGAPPAGGALALGKELLIPTGLGTFRPLAPPSEGPR